MSIAIGDRLPDVTFRTMSEGAPKTLTTADVFGGKSVVLFGVPGAFTPTCHKIHLPGFVKEAAAFKSKGVSEIAVVAVNDAFVMNIWAKETGGEGVITFLADGNAEFAKATGLAIDLSVAGLGTRIRRFSMLVEDGVVAKINIEEAPGKAELSSAEALICQF